MPKAITPVNVTPAATGWQDVAITAHVGADSGNVRGAILHIANQTGAARAFGVRPKGATTTRARNLANGWQAYQVVLVDGNDTFQVNCGSTDLEVYLIGYLLADEYNGLVNEVEVTPTEDGTYRTVDISAHVGSDTPIGAVLALDNGCNTTHPEIYIRPVGSTDDCYWRAFGQTNTLAIVKLDANKQFEAKVGGSCVNLFLLGWITANANFVTNLTFHGVSQAGQYETIDLSSEVDADAVGVWWFRDPGDTFPADAETVKEAGSSYDDEWLLGIAAPAWGFTKLSALKEIQYRSEDIDRTARIAVAADALEEAAPVDRTLIADPGPVSITGHEAALRAGRRIGAEAGAVAITARDAGLRRSARVPGEAGSVALGARDAGLRAARRLTAAGEAIALTAGDSGLRLDRRLAADGAALTLTAHDATLSRSADKTLVAEAGSVALTAHDAGLRRAARLAAQPGAVAIAPKVADLLRHGRLPAEPASIAIGAAAADLLRGRAMPAEPAAVAIAAQPVAFRSTRRLLAQGTALALVGQSADLQIPGRAEFVPGVPDVWTAAPRDTVWTAPARGTVWTAAPRGTVWTARKR